MHCLPIHVCQTLFKEEGYKDLNIFEELHPKLRSVIKKYGYVKPTLVQEKAIPLILKGLNILIVAPTGTGKTEAALFPVLSKLLEENSDELGIKVLYITPLRALNRDILRRMRSIASEVGFTAMVRHGDTPTSVRRKMTKEPPDILITTPETLQFVLTGRVIRTFLNCVKAVIVDEIHELIDDKRGVQLSVALERLAKIAGSYQRIGLSATISDVEVAKRFLGGFRRVHEVVVEMPRNTEIIVEFPTPTSDEEELAKALSVSPRLVARIRRISKLLSECESALIFTNTRDTAELLTTKLTLMTNERVGVHHGSLSREERISVEHDFKSKKLKALVCTSSMELGVDIGHVDLVVQYSSPRQALKLVQRVGRSGHKIGRVPKGVILAGDNDDLLESLIIARRALNNELESIDVHCEAYDVLAHQVIGLLIEYRKLRVEDIFNVITKAYPYSSLTISKLWEVINFLQELGYLRVSGNEVKLRRGAYRYYYENASTIPDTLRFRVKDIASSSMIGELDESFVTSYCEVGSTFILSGKLWKVVSVKNEDLIVEVVPSTDVLGAVPAWEGELIPVSYKVARELGALRRRIKEALLEGRDPLNVLKDYPGTASALTKVINYVKEQLREANFIPDDKSLVIENAGKVVVVHCTFGSKVNLTLGLLLSYFMSQMFYISVRFHSDPYRILLVLPRKVSTATILKVIKRIAGSRNILLSYLTEALRRSAMFKWRFAQVARRFGVIERKALPRIGYRFMEVFKNTVLEEEVIKELLVEKLDCERLRDLLEKISTNKISILTIETSMDSLSPIALPIVLSYVYSDYLIPLTPLKAVLKMIKRRLLEEEVKLVCLHKLDWVRVMKVKEISDELSCPICKSKFIAILRKEEDETLKVLRKKMKGIKLSGDEMRLLKRAQLSAKLFLTHGKLAAIALAGRGVGPVTAARILREATDESQLIELVFKAEREYSKTRQYWD